MWGFIAICLFFLVVAALLAYIPYAVYEERRTLQFYRRTSAGPKALIAVIESQEAALKSMQSDDELDDFPIVSSKPLLGRALKVDQTPLRHRRKALEAYEADVAKLVEENRINLELYYNKYPDRKPA